MAQVWVPWTQSTTKPPAGARLSSSFKAAKSVIACHLLNECSGTTSKNLATLGNSDISGHSWIDDSIDINGYPTNLIRWTEYTPVFAPYGKPFTLIICFSNVGSFRGTSFEYTAALLGLYDYDRFDFYINTEAGGGPAILARGATGGLETYTPGVYYIGGVVTNVIQNDNTLHRLIVRTESYGTLPFQINLDGSISGSSYNYTGCYPSNNSGYLSSDGLFHAHDISAYNYYLSDTEVAAEFSAPYGQGKYEILTEVASPMPYIKNHLTNVFDTSPYNMGIVI